MREPSTGSRSARRPSRRKLVSVVVALAVVAAVVVGVRVTDRGATSTVAAKATLPTDTVKLGDLAVSDRLDGTLQRTAELTVAHRISGVTPGTGSTSAGAAVATGLASSGTTTNGAGSGALTGLFRVGLVATTAPSDRATTSSDNSVLSSDNSVAPSDSSVVPSDKPDGSSDSSPTSDPSPTAPSTSATDGTTATATATSAVVPSTPAPPMSTATGSTTAETPTVTGAKTSPGFSSPGFASPPFSSSTFATATTSAFAASVVTAAVPSTAVVVGNDGSCPGTGPGASGTTTSSTDTTSTNDPSSTTSSTTSSSTTSTDPSLTTTTTTTVTTPPSIDPACSTTTTGPGDAGAGATPTVGGAIPAGGGGVGGAGAFPTGGAIGGARTSGGSGGASFSGGTGSAAAPATTPRELVTSLRPAGEAVHSGDVLYSVEGRPVVALTGTVPAWRDLAISADDGIDIQQLETALAALGYNDGGAMTVDATFDAATARAVSAWQTGLGLTATGKVALGSIVFIPADTTVTALVATVGQKVADGDQILRLATPSQQVVAEVPEKVRSVVGPGLAVTVNGVKGTVNRLGSGTGTNGAVTVQAYIGLEGPVAAADGTSVSARFTVTDASDVLLVPAQSVASRIDGSYAVLAVDDTGTGGTWIPVEVHGVANGQVAVSGDGLRQGLTIATAGT